MLFGFLWGGGFFLKTGIARHIIRLVPGNRDAITERPSGNGGPAKFLPEMVDAKTDRGIPGGGDPHGKMGLRALIGRGDPGGARGNRGGLGGPNCIFQGAPGLGLPAEIGFVSRQKFNDFRDVVGPACFLIRIGAPLTQGLANPVRAKSLLYIRRGTPGGEGEKKPWGLWGGKKKNKADSGAQKRRPAEIPTQRLRHWNGWGWGNQGGAEGKKKKERGRAPPEWGAWGGKRGRLGGGPSAGFQQYKPRAGFWGTPASHQRGRTLDARNRGGAAGWGLRGPISGKGNRRGHGGGGLFAGEKKIIPG